MTISSMGSSIFDICLISEITFIFHVHVFLTVNKGEEREHATVQFIHRDNRAEEGSILQDTQPEGTGRVAPQTSARAPHCQLHSTVNQKRISRYLRNYIYKLF